MENENQDFSNASDESYDQCDLCTDVVEQCRELCDGCCYWDHSEADYIEYQERNND